MLWGRMYKTASTNQQHASISFAKDIQNGLARELTPLEQLQTLSDASTKLNEMARTKDYSVYDKRTLGQKIQENNLEIVRLKKMIPKRAQSIEEFFAFFARKLLNKQQLRTASLQARGAYDKYGGDFDAFQSHEMRTRPEATPPPVVLPGPDTNTGEEGEK